MNTNNDITGDRITNALKGDKEKYREGWEAIFGKSKPIYKGKKSAEHIEESTDEELLDEITRLDQEMGLYDEDS